MVTLNEHFRICSWKRSRKHQLNLRFQIIKVLWMGLWTKAVIGPNTYDDQIKFIEEKFDGLNANPDKTIYMHQVRNIPQLFEKLLLDLCDGHKPSSNDSGFLYWFNHSVESSRMWSLLMYLLLVRFQYFKHALIHIIWCIWIGLLLNFQVV